MQQPPDIHSSIILTSLCVYVLTQFYHNFMEQRCLKSILVVNMCD